MGYRYEKLDIVDFGRQLLSSGDLDPVYLALNRSPWDRDRKLRWLVAYCAFYHAGAATWLSQHRAGAFWGWMELAAYNELVAPPGGRWPRGAERRHFRGGLAVQTIANWREQHPEPETMFLQLVDKGPLFSDVRTAARSIYSVGDWMSFKMVDLVDACLDGEIDQSNLQDFMYEAPVKSLLREWKVRMGFSPDQEAKPKDLPGTIQAMNDWLRLQLSDQRVPHKPGRPLDNFCLETIWCKYGSHLNGHYPVGHDIREIRKGLEGWKADDFGKGLPE